MREGAAETVYEAPARTAAWWAAAVGGSLFVLGLAWVVARIARGPWVMLALAALVASSLAGPRLLGVRGPLRARRVVARPADKTVTVTHARGELTLRFDDVRDVSHGEVIVGEGVPVDVVTVTREGGEPVVFSVVDRGAAEGTARALRAVLEASRA